jgi:hypothetical protein
LEEFGYIFSGSWVASSDGCGVCISFYNVVGIRRQRLSSPETWAGPIAHVVGLGYWHHVGG